MTLKFGTQVEEIKIAPRNFFWVRIFSGFKMEKPKEKLYTWMVSDWENLLIRNNFAGSFKPSIYELRILFIFIGQLGELLFKIFQEKSGISHFL
jgi:hypothetical protein